MFRFTFQRGFVSQAVCVYDDDVERKAAAAGAGIRFQMYVKRAHQHHHLHNSVSVGTSSTAGGRTSPSPAHVAASNPVVLQAPVVQHIRASANCRGNAAGGSGASGGCGPQSAAAAALGGCASISNRNEPHPLARLAAAADQDVADDEAAQLTRSGEASRSGVNDP